MIGWAGRLDAAEHITIIQWEMLTFILFEFSPLDKG